MDLEHGKNPIFFVYKRKPTMKVNHPLKPQMKTSKNRTTIAYKSRKGSKIWCMQSQKTRKPRWGLKRWSMQEEEGLLLENKGGQKGKKQKSSHL